MHETKDVILERFSSGQQRELVAIYGNFINRVVN
jgi:hypothetical protein